MNSNQQPIYLDYHSTTPVDPRVLEAMLPYFENRFGNAASRSHSYGWQASEAVELARRQVASLLHVNPEELFFTSGATEGLNTLIKGMVDSTRKKGNQIVTIATEHHAVLDVFQWLGTKGYENIIIPVNQDGNVDLEKFNQTINRDTILVCAMWANNETGVIHDIARMAFICKEKEVPFICDATQAVGKMDINPKAAGVDMMVCSAHKFYGPKGIGIMYIDAALKVKPTPLIHGGGHEEGRRSGTLNVPAIVGMGEAAKICMAEMKPDRSRIEKMRDEFEKQLLEELELVTINGKESNRLPTVSNVCVRLTESQAVMTKFRSKLAISSGSACSSANPQPSHVLLAMGLSEDEAKASYRFSLGRPTTEEEVREAVRLFINAINEYRSQSPLWEMYKNGMDISIPGRR
ncbi:MAG TPA: cysteine desulfurase family protein [Saprospiraceae bacterium]|nr:cysteine desulfurase family protein [Saprospiraceae bacterium]